MRKTHQQHRIRDLCPRIELCGPLRQRTLRSGVDHDPRIRLRGRRGGHQAQLGYRNPRSPVDRFGRNRLLLPPRRSSSTASARPTDRLPTTPTTKTVTCVSTPRSPTTAARSRSPRPRPARSSVRRASGRVPTPAGQTLTTRPKPKRATPALTDSYNGTPGPYAHPDTTTSRTTWPIQSAPEAAPTSPSWRSATPTCCSCTPRSMYETGQMTSEIWDATIRPLRERAGFDADYCAYPGDSEELASDHPATNAAPNSRSKDAAASTSAAGHCSTTPRSRAPEPPI